MATYKQVSYGSQGSDVTELQKLLNNNGYNLSVDGIYGAKTQEAVKDYQKKNGLTVDGIVGNNTWGALTGGNKTATTPAATKPTTTQTTTPATKEFTYEDFKVSEGTAAADKKRQELEAQKPGEFTYDAYVKSDIVKAAEAALEQQLANKPGEYSSQWQAALDETMNKILNREKFSYDLNGDALYQQYKDQYMLQGQQAMMDTMGQAAAMTGGYGNSYAQSVGQQTYQGYLQQLNDKVPELYQLALDQYNREGEDLYNQYGLYADRENTDYGRYRDTVSDYYTELDRLTENARYLSEDEYNKYMDDLNMKYGIHRDEVSDYYTNLGLANDEYWNSKNFDYGTYSDNRNLAYTDHRNQVSDNQWNQEFAYKQERDNVSDEQWQKTFDEGVRQFNVSQATTQSQSETKRRDEHNAANAPSGWTEQDIREFQKENGLTVDGIWGKQSQAKYEELYGEPEPKPGPEPQPEPTGFTGTTYKEAVAYAKSKGVDNSYASGILTQREFSNAIASGSSIDGANEFDTYAEYLEYAVDSLIDAYGKK